MTHFPWRPRFVFGVAGDLTDWSTILPARPWERVTPTIGGSRTAAGGTPAAYVVRRDYNIRLPLRLYETELQNLSALFEWAQGAESFLWYPDATVTTAESAYTVYLESPLAGESWTDARMAGFQEVAEVSIVLRRVDGYAWDLDFFGC